MDVAGAAGVTVPKLGLGTWQLRSRECAETVERALEMGYRHVDTAEYYDNQRAVGEGIARADADREEVFLVTKVWRTNLRREDVLRVGREAVDRLGTAPDLLLIHWPNASVPIEETIGAMNELQDEGLVEHVGVSNFSVAQLEGAMAASRTPVVTDQVEYHPYESRDELLAFCLDEDVLLTAYSPLAKGRVTSDDTLREIGDRHGRTAAQVALRWLVQQPGVVAIPKASSERHLRENLAVLDFELTDAEMERIFELDGGLFDRLRSRIGL